MNFFASVDEARKFRPSANGDTNAYIASLGSFFSFNFTSTATDNSATIIKPDGTWVTGRWLIAGQTLSTLSNSIDHVTLNTTAAGKTVRINSRTESTDTANSLIGFQSKPAMGVATAQNVIGAEISPRVNSGIALTGTGSIIGLHVDAYLKGTAAGTIAGDVRGQQIELVTDDAGARNITGNVSALRLRMAFSAGTVTGNIAGIRIEKPETQTNSKNYDAVLELTGDNGTIWKDDYTTEVTTLSGAIKVLVNGQVRYIPLYSGAPEV